MSSMFPQKLRPYADARLGTGMRVNVLVNYGWEWDLRTAAQGDPKRRFHGRLASADVSRIDLLVRWGGMRRLSGIPGDVLASTSPVVAAATAKEKDP
jgi:undecaprenyl diphosphate synthase